jgi:acyl-CoA hydrolase
VTLELRPVALGDIICLEGQVRTFCTFAFSIVFIIKSSSSSSSCCLRVSGCPSVMLASIGWVDKVTRAFGSSMEVVVRVSREAMARPGTGTGTGSDAPVGRSDRSSPTIYVCRAKAPP